MSNVNYSLKNKGVRLNTTAKKQIVEHFYDDNGKRNCKKVAYFGIEKDKD